ncbi:MAG TPA: flagellar motor switch phosphatase FliY, partial [Bacillota bacterium]|nr:flagellar motor switch phosphatase FliY [Bacillota bacterium]
MSNGVLSQEEIDALLNSSSGPSEEPVLETAPAAAPTPAAMAEPAPMAAAEAAAQPAAAVSTANYPDISNMLNDMEKDAIGEVGNISMGSAATALATLLDRRVEITTPTIEITTYGQIRSQYPLPFLVVDVSYTRGIEGTNLLVIRHQDAAIIADLMMGNDGTNPPEELSEFYLGAVGEAMNQMMGSTCTAMSSVLGQRIEIGTPTVRTVHLANENLAQTADENEPIIKVNFQMQVGDLINSEIMQILPVNFTRQLLTDLMHSMEDTPQQAPVAAPPAPEQPPAYQPPAYQAPPSQPAVQPMAAQGQPELYPPQGYPQQPNMYPPQTGYPPQGGYAPQNGFPPQGYPQYGQPPVAAAHAAMPFQGQVQVQPAQFTSLTTGSQLQEYGNIGLIMDVPLQITVELGKTRKTIKEILALGPGSVLELDKLAGEPVDLLVNG